MPNYFEFAYLKLTHGYIYLFANYFIALCVPVVLSDFEKKRNLKSVLILIAEMLACVVVMELLAAIYFAIFNSDRFVPFVCGLIVTILYALIRCKKSYAVRLMRSCTFMGLSSLALSVTMSMGMLLGPPYYYLQWVLITLNGIVIISSAFFVGYFSVSDEIPVASGYTVIISVMGALCYAFSILRRAIMFDPAAAIALSLIFFFMDFLIYFGTGHLIKNSYREENLRTNEIMLNADKDLFRMSNENLETLRELRHEVKNHYAIMQTLIDEGDYERLKDYFSEYSENIEKAVEFPDCGNHTFNVIIEIERSRVSKAKAEFESKISVPPKLKIPDSDLCSLVMNLVTNAAEYYERNENAEKRRIILEAFTVNGALLVKVSNDILPEHAESALTLKTSKENAKMHGYGSKVVAAIVNKYNGSVSYEVKGGMFTVCTMLFSE